MNEFEKEKICSFDIVKDVIFNYNNSIHDIIVKDNNEIILTNCFKVPIVISREKSYYTEGKRNFQLKKGK